MVSGAAGGVGAIAVQLARLAGASVIGLAGASNQGPYRQLAGGHVRGKIVLTMWRGAGTTAASEARTVEV